MKIFALKKMANFFPIPMRAMQYDINQSLSNEEYDSVEKMIHELAVGVGFH